MEKPNLNLVIFDDDDEVSHISQMKKYTSISKNSNKTSQINGHQSQKNLKNPIQNSKAQMILKQISLLQSNIQTLQRQGQRIKHEIQKRNDKNTGISSGLSSMDYKQIQQVLTVVERKIQLVIQQSKKIIVKMTENFDKKFEELIINKKNSSPDISEIYRSKITQIQNVLRHKTEQYQRHYKNEQEKLLKESKRRQQLMMKKLSEIEQKFMNKLNTFQKKQKQYVDWIHHLQAKLKQRKSKKMITITQEKPQLNPLVSKQSLMSSQNLNHQNNHSNAENVPSINFPISKVNCSIDQNSSKMARKHKIFGNKEVSPVARNSNISPTKDYSTYNNVQTIKNPKYQAQSNFTQQPSKGTSSFTQQSQIPGANLGFFNQLNNQNQNNTQNQFYKNVPKANTGWDKFADMNEYSQEYTQSQSDDFFTPIDAQDNIMGQRVLANIPLDSRGGSYYGYGESQREVEKRQNYGYVNQNSQKVFSPFDLN